LSVDEKGNDIYEAGRDGMQEDGKFDVRRYLCLSLRSQRNPEFIPLLTRLRKDPDFNVRLDASRALKGPGPLSDPEGF